MFRILAKIETKGWRVIKPIQFDGVRVVGEPKVMATTYYQEGADEIVWMDSVASLYGRASLPALLACATQNVFIPVTAVGGIRSLEDATRFLRSGADRVGVNSAAIKNPSLLNEISNQYGNQCLVLSIEAIRNRKTWEVLTLSGREKTGKEVKDWAAEAEARGVGEILLTSVDRDGTLKGLDLDLIEAVTSKVKIPVIVSGGAGTPNQVLTAAKIPGVNGIALARVLHEKHYSIAQIKSYLIENGVAVR